MSSAYAVPVDQDEHEGSPPDQMQQLVAIDEYIREFDHGDTVKAAELFTPYVSCNLALFGMREFGGGENYHSGIQNSRYFAWHVAMMAIYVPGMYVTLHCTGIRVWVAAAISAATFPPLMVVSMIAESKIFRSRFLAAKLLRRGEDVKALKTK